MIRLRPANQKNYTHVVDWIEGQKRRRKFFTSYKQAKLWMERKTAALRLVPAGEPPPTPDEFRAVIEARRLQVPLMDAVIDYQRRHGRERYTLAQLIDSRLAAVRKSGVTAKYVQRVESVLSVAKQTIGALPAEDISPSMCQQFLARWKEHHTQKYGRAILGAVFRHGQLMGYCDHNPASKLPLIRRPAAVPVSLFLPHEAAQWLQCLAPQLVAGWAIALFAGLRRAEVERLQWSEVKLSRGYIEVTAAKSKTRTRRLVDIMPNLAAILRTRIAEGEVFPHSPKRWEAAARKAYGRPIPKNAARHSFVSYHLALYGDVAKTELQAGHDRGVLFSNYRELVTKEQAEEYFSITL